VTEFDPPEWEELTETERAQCGTGEFYYANQREVQAAIIGHLAHYAPLVLVVFSGGKSLHAWWPCRGKDEDELRKFMSFAVKLGADPATWTRSQFARLPGGMRENGVRQSVLFFNPRNLEVR
jgi:hypothetical protein